MISYSDVYVSITEQYSQYSLILSTIMINTFPILVILLNICQVL